MNLSRRTLLGGVAGTALIMPFGAFGATNGSVTREFSVSRGTSNAGRQKITLWEGGILQSISGKTDDNGKSDFVEARRTGAGLEVKGSDYSGVVKGNIASTSFFTTSLLDRSTWVSTQGGKPIAVKVTKKGRATLGLPGGNVPCTHYHFGGKLKIPIDAYFDDKGDLAGYMFDARGERARVLANSMTPDLKSIWI